MDDMFLDLNQPEYTFDGAKDITKNTSSSELIKHSSIPNSAIPASEKSNNQQCILPTESATERDHLSKLTNDSQNSIKCLGCSSYFITRSSHQSHQLYWQIKGNFSHNNSCDNPPLGSNTQAPKPSQQQPLQQRKFKPKEKKRHDVETRQRTRSTKFTSSNKKPYIVDMTPTQRQTLHSLQSNTTYKSFVEDIDSDKSSNKRDPQTYIVLAPVLSRKVVPINPEPGMMAAILSSIKYVVLHDLDNMAKWCNLRAPISDVFIWGFYGDKMPGLPVWDNPNFNSLVEKQRFWMTSCGQGANSADFALSFYAAQLNLLCPPDVTFIVVSNDHDLHHPMAHLLSSGRHTFNYRWNSEPRSVYLDDMIQHAAANTSNKELHRPLSTPAGTTFSVPVLSHSKPLYYTNLPQKESVVIIE